MDGCPLIGFVGLTLVDGFKGLIRSLARSFGYDFVRYPMLEEYLLVEQLQTIFRSLDINCVLDVGAHHGEFVRLVKRIGYSGYIRSFEPVASSFAVLSKAFGGDIKWRGYPFALGDQETRLTIHETEYGIFSSFLKPNDYCEQAFGERGRVIRSTEVSVRRLENVFDECIAGIENPRVFLKLDTQGFDLRVLKGAGGRLSSILALQTQMSVQPIYQGIMSYLEAIPLFNAEGFRVAGLIPVSWGPSLEMVEFDCLMVRCPPVALENAQQARKAGQMVETGRVRN